MSFPTESNIDVNQTSNDSKPSSSSDKFVRKEHNSYDYYIKKNKNETNSKIANDASTDKTLTKDIAPVSNISCEGVTNKVAINRQLSCVPLSAKKEIINSLTQIIGLQEKFFYLILECCNITKSLQTPKLKTTDIAELIQGKFYTTKSVMTIVSNKGFVQRLKGKSARFGFVQFAVSKEIKKVGNKFLEDKKAKDQKFSDFIDKIRQTIVSKT